MSVEGISTALLILTTAINVGAIAYFWRRANDGMWLRVFLLVNYLIDYPISGLAHTLRWSRDRGYYEALSGAPVGAQSGLLTAAVATLVGLLAIIVGLLYVRPRKRPHEAAAPISLLRDWPRFSWIVTLGIIGVCGASLVKIRSVVSELDAERIIAVDGGNARYVFLAAWLPVGVMMLALLLLRRAEDLTSQFRNVVILFLATGFIAVATSYDGGRAGPLLSAIPLLALFLPHIKRLRVPSLVLGALLLAVFVAVQTQKRVLETNRFDFWSLLDWQWGRFSMIAWSERYSTVHGSLHGDTFMSSLLAVPDALAHFLNVQLPFSDYPSAVELTGISLRGTEEAIFIVPGYLAELNLNFGLFGVAVGCLILAILTGKLADLFRDSRFEVERLLIAALASVVVFGTLVAQFEAFFQAVVLGFLPLWGLWLLERMLLSRRNDVPSDGNSEAVLTATPRRQSRPAQQ